MDPRIPIALITLTTLALAGCITPDDAGAARLDGGRANATDAPAPQEDETSASTAGVAPATGSVRVTTRMPDQSPVARVEVTIGNATATTDAEGVARFEDLPAGTLNGTATKEAHRTAQFTATVRAHATTDVDVELQPVDGDVHEHAKGLVAHHDTYRFAGRFDCSATYLIITGDCLLVVDHALNESGVDARPGDGTQERNIIDFPLDRSWSALVVEMTWDAPEAGYGDAMTLALEPAEAPADGHAAKYARTHGGAPLRLELFPGVVHASATAEDKPNPEGGEVIRARAFVEGVAHNPGDTPFLGVGAAVNHEFTLVVSIFYGDLPPAGYSALEGGD